MPKATELSTSNIPQKRKKFTKNILIQWIQHMLKNYYGTYLIYRQTAETTKIHSRIYMSSANNIEFIKALQEAGHKKIHSSNQVYKKNVLDLFPQYSNFIIDSLLQIVPENSNESTIREYLHACGLF